MTVTEAIQEQSEGCDSDRYDCLTLFILMSQAPHLGDIVQVANSIANRLQNSSVN